MVQMVSRALKPLGRPKQKRPTSKLQNTTVRDFGGGLNVVDSEQNLTSKFSPVFDNMVTYTDRRVGPRYGYEMWLKLKTGTTASMSVSISIGTTAESRYVIVNHPLHGLTLTTPTNPTIEHVTISGWDITYNGVTPAMMNRTHSVYKVFDANSYQIFLTNSATLSGTSPNESVTVVRDNHLLGGEPIECKYFSNYVILWTSVGEIIRIDRNKIAQRIWSASIAMTLPDNSQPWSATELVASDIFRKDLICSNGRDKPLKIDFTQTDGNWVRYLSDTDGSFEIPAFDACKSAFRYFTVHDTDPRELPEHLTEIRISAQDTAVVYSGSSAPNDAVDIDMSAIIASPEQAVRGFAIIKDALLVITPNATTMMKYGAKTEATLPVHDPAPVDTLTGFGTNAPRTIVEIGSDMFMIDFNGVPSAKLSTLSNNIVPERVSNYIETMLSQHIGRLRKETMRLHAFGFFDAKNKTVHFYLPKYDLNDMRDLTADPLFFDADMAKHDFLKRTLVMRLDDHQLEQGDTINISGATSFSGVSEANINGVQTIMGILSVNYVLISINQDLPMPASSSTTNGGGNAIIVHPRNDATVGYIYHYVPQLKLTAWSRFKTKNTGGTSGTGPLRFNCGCGTIEGRSFLFTQDGYMMRYGSPDHQVYADWYGMYDFISWTSGQAYFAGQRVFDGADALVYKCLANVTTTATTFAEARALEPDSWEEYKGEPVEFAWELPWSDFGQRQATKGLRFIHLDANGTSQFKLAVFADNIYKNAATGQLTPARELLFVPNESPAYGAGSQVYGAGRRTREQKLWQVPIKCKILKTRITGNTTGPMSISAISMMYQRGSLVRG